MEAGQLLSGLFLWVLFTGISIYGSSGDFELISRHSGLKTWKNDKG